jgi:hypothetical protein
LLLRELYYRTTGAETDEVRVMGSSWSLPLATRKMQDLLGTHRRALPHHNMVSHVAPAALAGGVDTGEKSLPCDL